MSGSRAEAKAKYAAQKAAADTLAKYNADRAASKIDFFPSPEQMEWLKIMVKHSMLDPESVDSDKVFSESSNSIGKVYLIKTVSSNISEFKFGKLVSVAKRESGLSGLDYTFTDSNESNFSVSTSIDITIYSLYKDELPTHDPRLPDQDKLVVTEPTTEQLKWLKIMADNNLLEPLNKTLTLNDIGTYYLYRNPKTNLFVGGYLFNVREKIVQVGGEAGYWMNDYSPSPPPARQNKHVSEYSFYNENGSVENDVREDKTRIYALPATLPTRNPLLPEKLVTTPTPDQLKWMAEMMSYVIDFKLTQVNDLTEDNKGTYYLYKDDTTVNSPLFGGYLFNVREKIVQVGGEAGYWMNDYSPSPPPARQNKHVSEYSFYNENGNVTTVRSDQVIVYSLPVRLPKTPPKSRSFKRIVDVDDITGEFTLHDGITVTFPEDKLAEYFFIVCPPSWKSGSDMFWFNVSRAINPNYKAYTGKLVTSTLVQMICGDMNDDSTGKHEFYVQYQNTTFDTVTTSDTVTPSSSITPPTILFIGKNPTTDDDDRDIKSISETTKDKPIGEKLCKTRAEPVESVKGPVLPRLDASKENFKKLEGVITCYNPSLHNEMDVYVQLGYYLTKATIFSKAENPKHLVVQAILDPTIRFDWAKDQIFVLDRDISIAKSDKEVYALRNIKRIPPNKKLSNGAEIYFYLGNNKSRNAIRGIIVKKALFSSTYTVKYKEDGVEKNAEKVLSELYERDEDAEKYEAAEDKKATDGSSLTGAGKKNKTKRRNIRKSLKKKQSRKGRIFRTSVKTKFRRSRVRK